MNRVKCFLLIATDLYRVSLRRYESAVCGTRTYHNAHSVSWQEKGAKPIISGPDAETVAAERGLAFPEQCECGYIFTSVSQTQVFRDRLYRIDGSEELTTWNDAAPGAMVNCEWLNDTWRVGPDGQSLQVKLPDGFPWLIDGQANNCTMPSDTVHKCWVRHGVPPNITVDKSGNTCQAGAGSIGTPSYHGFLRNGYLEEC